MRYQVKDNTRSPSDSPGFREGTTSPTSICVLLEKTVHAILFAARNRLQTGRTSAVEPRDLSDREDLRKLLNLRSVLSQKCKTGVN